MGDRDEGAKGGFLLIDGTTWDPKSLWSSEVSSFGYDFWYQPRHNIMVSSEFGTPHCFKKGFNPNEVPSDYGKSLYFWNWAERKLIKKTDLGAEGMIPLEVRFLHEPTKPHGFVGAALSSSVIHFYRDDSSGDWKHEKIIQVESRDVTGWILPSVPGLITDILISMDDRFIFFRIGYRVMFDNMIFRIRSILNWWVKFLLVGLLMVQLNLWLEKLLF
jgi:selenium-binding protein 1